MSKRLSSLVLLFILAVASAIAQPKMFGRDPEVFLKELEKFLTENKEAQTILIFDKFAANYRTKLDEGQQIKVIKASNEFLNKKFTAADFEKYIHLINAFIEQGKLNQFNDWNKLLDPRLKQDSKDLRAFIDNTSRLIEKGILVEQQSRYWASSNLDFTIKEVQGRGLVIFKNTTLKCVTSGDSAFIENTSGSYDLDNLLWEGKGGKVTWERAGFSRSKVFAELKSYKVDLNKNQYNADSVSYTNTEYFGTKLNGNLEEKIFGNTDSTRLTYPRFYSFQKDLAIDKFSEDLKYTGGFSHQGKNIIAYGDDKSPATFKGYYKSKLILLARAPEFVIQPNDRIESDKADIILYLDTSGTITHPKAYFYYVNKNKTVTMTRGKEGITRAPFVDNYHQVEIIADYIQWKMDEPKLDIRMVLRSEAAYFESNNFFRDMRYEKIQGLLDENPLQKIKSYCDLIKRRKFNLQQYADYAKSQTKYLMTLFVSLHDNGFVKFNPKTLDVEVYDKIYNYVNAHMGRIDNDVISFQSVIEALPNASVNLENYHMKIEGVPTFKFSDSQNVFVIPTEQRLVLKKNRDMLFDGMIRAGRFEFFGREFEFAYTKFNIEMNNIDSLRFYVPDNASGGRLRKVNSVLQDMTGTLLIDEPYNKSGRRDFPEYPIFKARKGSKIYYDQPQTFGGVYVRDKFYFEVDPFTIDSLDNFTLDGLLFDGTMVSGGIFPEFREQARVQEDFSLGFKRVHESSMYGGVGKGQMNLSLSNRGFFGNGNIDFAGSVSTSQESFTLFIDSTVGMSKSLEVNESGTNPKASGVNTFMRWLPYEDKMSHFTTTDAVRVYNDAQFFGEYIIASKGSSGNGNLNFNDAELHSNDLKFLPKNVTAESSTLLIKSIDTAKFAFKATDVKANVDMEKRLGDFKANSEDASSEFPYNTFKCSLNEFKWDIGNKNLKFITPPGKPEEKSYFISTNAFQDSLRFISTDADYSLTDYIIIARKVPEIKVSDASIIPDSGKVIVRQNGELDSLKNSIIWLDTASKYHKLYACNVRIVTRHDFGGNGKFDYVTKDGNKYMVLMDSIKADKRYGGTEAYGSITVEDDFVLHPKIDYWGRIKLTGQRKDIYLDGYLLAKNNIDYLSMRAGWFRHKQYVDKDSLVFGVAYPQNIDQKDVFSGIYTSNDTAIVYGILFDRKRVFSDPGLISVEKGLFFYDDAQRHYVFGDSNKIMLDDRRGALMTVNDETGDIHTEGPIDFAITTPGIQLNTAGYIDYNTDRAETEMRMAMVMDFPFPPDVVKGVNRLITENSLTAEPVNYSEDYIKKALAELVPDNRDFAKVLRQIESTNSITSSDPLMKTLFIADAPFTYNPKRKSFVCSGKIQLNSVGENVVGRRLEARIEILRKRSGDEITIYIELESQQFVFFQYNRKSLYFFTSDDLILNSYKEGMSKYSKDGLKLRLATQQTKTKFLRTFEAP